MKILHAVQSYPPSTGGMQEVVSQLSRRLVKEGHRVTVATSAMDPRPRTVDGVVIEQFDISGSTLRGYGNKKEVERYQQFLINSKFDVITLFAAQQWATDLALPVLDQIKARKVFVPTGFSALPLARYRKYFDNLAQTMPIFDMNVFLSDDYRDINFARQHGIKKNKTMIIPNGAAEEEFLPAPKLDIRSELGIDPDTTLVLTVGSHNRQKGHAEAIAIFRRANITNATLVIVGNTVRLGCRRSCQWQASLFNRQKTNKLAGKKILIPALDRKATVAAYKAADIFLFPSQIECSPLVLFESCAAKTPFLSTDVGNAKEIVSWTKGGMILPTEIDRKGLAHAETGGSALMLEDLSSNQPLREKLATAGFQAWKKSFTWGILTEEYNKLYQSLI